MIQLTNTILAIILARLVATAPTVSDDGKLKGAYLGLVTDSASYDSTAALGDITEAGFVGYARQSITWDSAGVYVDSDGNESISAGLHSFTPSDDTIPQVIKGVALFSASTAGVLWGIERFADPVSVIGPTTPCKVVPSISLPTAADYGETVIID